MYGTSVQSFKVQEFSVIPMTPDATQDIYLGGLKMSVASGSSTMTLSGKNLSMPTMTVTASNLINFNSAAGAPTGTTYNMWLDTTSSILYYRVASVWHPIDTSTVEVLSVAGRTGAVVLTLDDCADTATRVAVTPAEKSAITHANRANLDTINQNMATTDAVAHTKVTVNEVALSGADKKITYPNTSAMYIGSAGQANMVLRSTAGAETMDIQCKSLGFYDMSSNPMGTYTTATGTLACTTATVTNIAASNITTATLEYTQPTFTIRSKDTGVAPLDDAYPSIAFESDDASNNLRMVARRVYFHDSAVAAANTMVINPQIVGGVYPNIDRVTYPTQSAVCGNTGYANTWDSVSTRSIDVRKEIASGDPVISFIADTTTFGRIWTTYVDANNKTLRFGFQTGAGTFIIKNVAGVRSSTLDVPLTLTGSLLFSAATFNLGDNTNFVATAYIDNIVDPSLRVLKTDIKPLDGDHCIDLVKRMNPVSYRLKRDLDRQRFGFIYEDVAPLLPDDFAGLYEGEGLDYKYFPMILFGALKKLLSQETPRVSTQASDKFIMIHEETTQNNTHLRFPKTVPFDNIEDVIVFFKDNLGVTRKVEPQYFTFTQEHINITYHHIGTYRIIVKTC